MTKAISIALIVGGIVLLYFGGQAFNSVRARDSSAARSLMGQFRGERRGVSPPILRA